MGRGVQRPISDMRPHGYQLASRDQVTLALFVVSIGLALGLGRVLELTAWPIPWWFDSPAVFGFYAWAWFVYDRWLWRMAPLRDLLGVPDMNGDWDVLAVSSFDQKEHLGTATITQTWSTLSVIGHFAKSTSWSLSAHLVALPDDRFEFVYTYDSRPKATAVATSMRQHRGTTWLAVSPTGDRMEGEYFTCRERSNQGTLRLIRRP